MWGTPNPVPVLFNIVDPHGYECIEKGRCGSPGSRLLVRLGEYGCWTALSNLLGCLGWLLKGTKLEEAINLVPGQAAHELLGCLWDG